MGLTNYPNGITSFGVPVLGGSGEVTTGDILFVDSTATNATDGNLGDSPESPLATLNGALTRATANNGDIVYLMPGHAEDVTSATSHVIDKAGIKFIGLGVGDNRTTFTYTAVGGSFECDAANTEIYNFRFFSSISAVVVGVNVDADNTGFFACDWCTDG